MVGAAETPYDLRFRLLEIPVRVHPLFWIVMAVLGWEEHNLPMVVVWVACGFVSILVHEYGHGLMSKIFGSSPSIVLWGMGGLCYSQGERQSLGQRLAVVLSGPAAGLGLYMLVMVATSASFGVTASEHVSLSEAVLRITPNREILHSAVQRFPGGDEGFTFQTYWFLIQINLLWSLFNLLPIWPLDGGQAAQILLSFYDRARGPRWGHIISLLFAGGLAIMALSQGSDNLFRALFLGYFAMINFQMLQSLHQAHSMGLYQEDDWWRR
jgi:stage IV sporulation protein FB